LTLWPLQRLLNDSDFRAERKEVHNTTHFIHQPDQSPRHEGWVGMSGTRTGLPDTCPEQDRSQGQTLRRFGQRLRERETLSRAVAGETSGAWQHRRHTGRPRFSSPCASSDGARPSATPLTPGLSTLARHLSPCGADAESTAPAKARGCVPATSSLPPPRSPCGGIVLEIARPLA
jgi:hypothetical protein